jgi:hypothetical protein
MRARWSTLVAALWLGGCPPADTKPGDHSGTPTDTQTTEDATWTDAASGLTWEVEPNEAQTWEAAGARCDGSTLGGHDDWRLPTISELRTLIVDCQATAPGGTCGVTDTCADSSTCRGDTCEGCGYQPGTCYRPAELSGNCAFAWSSTLDTDDPDQAWGVGFDGGHVSRGLLTNSSASRCVR